MSMMIWDHIKKYYSLPDYAALAAQKERWQDTRPLAGAKILDGTPVFRNTLIKYAVLLDAGADLTISVGKDIPCDASVIKAVSEFGIRVADDEILKENFDAVADCAGRHIQVKSRCGYAELTRSGLEYYKNSDAPVFSVDSGILKRFETTLGTGESFVRAMNYLNYTDFDGKNILIFGGGKVGCGTAYFSAKAGARVLIADMAKITPPPQVGLIDAGDHEAVFRAIKNAWCVVSATGAAGVLADFVPALKSSGALIANMGVEDEFGETLPASKVLNHKLPLNFILDEPTKTSYIDPSMALSNEALKMLLDGKISPGINLPPEDLEMQIISDIRNAGTMNEEIELILNEVKK